jgi:hypothetical protein
MGVPGGSLKVVVLLRSSRIPPIKQRKPGGWEMTLGGNGMDSISMSLLILNRCIVQKRRIQRKKEEVDISIEGVKRQYSLRRI